MAPKRDGTGAWRCVPGDRAGVRGFGGVGSGRWTGWHRTAILLGAPQEVHAKAPSALSVPQRLDSQRQPAFDMNVDTLPRLRLVSLGLLGVRPTLSSSSSESHTLPVDAAGTAGCFFGKGVPKRRDLSLLVRRRSWRRTLCCCSHTWLRLPHATKSPDRSRGDSGGRGELLVRCLEGSGGGGLLWSSDCRADSRACSSSLGSGPRTWVSLWAKLEDPLSCICRSTCWPCLDLDLDLDLDRSFNLCGRGEAGAADDDDKMVTCSLGGCGGRPRRFLAWRPRVGVGICLPRTPAGGPPPSQGLASRTQCRGPQALPATLLMRRAFPA